MAQEQSSDRDEQGLGKKTGTGYGLDPEFFQNDGGMQLTCLAQ